MHFSKVMKSTLMGVALALISVSSNASILSQQFIYDDIQLDFALSSDNAEVDTNSLLVFTDLASPSESFAFMDAFAGISFAASDLSNFDVFEVYTFDVLEDGIVSFALSFFSDDFEIILEYDQDADFFYAYIENLVSGEVLLDVFDFSDSLVSNSISVTDAEAVSAPALSAIGMIVALMLIRRRRLG
ncbi:hypothetical protein ACFO4O_16735 [Glaciecola siphonariae]|uniref:PEP-CTERM protein-sorting domain-containing protein n=1 Tax=Glaciecola siphonariae TaxID=521012 RepID=A0ABV9LZ43_9ALTE